MILNGSILTLITIGSSAATALVAKIAETDNARREVRPNMIARRGWTNRFLMKNETTERVGNMLLQLERMWIVYEYEKKRKKVWRKKAIKENRKQTKRAIRSYQATQDESSSTPGASLVQASARSPVPLGYHPSLPMRGLDFYLCLETSSASCIRTAVFPHTTPHLPFYK